jgi:membrane-associated phospholipid phosphatase
MPYHHQLKVYLVQLAFVTSTWLLSGIIHHIIKIVLGRYRPRYLFSENWYGINPLNFNIAHNSFPSGHTQTIFAITIGLTLLYPRLGVFLVPLAFSVGISRVVLIAHYPSDVLFGAYLGMATAILVKRHYFDRRNIF